MTGGTKTVFLVRPFDFRSQIELVTGPAPHHDIVQPIANSPDATTAGYGGSGDYVGPRGGVYHYTASGNKEYNSSGHHR